MGAFARIFREEQAPPLRCRRGFGVFVGTGGLLRFGHARGPQIMRSIVWGSRIAVEGVFKHTFYIYRREILRFARG